MPHLCMPCMPCMHVRRVLHGALGDRVSHAWWAGPASGRTRYARCLYKSSLAATQRAAGRESSRTQLHRTELQHEFAAAISICTDACQGCRSTMRRMCFQATPCTCFCAWREMRPWATEACCWASCCVVHSRCRQSPAAVASAHLPPFRKLAIMDPVSSTCSQHSSQAA